MTWTLDLEHPFGPDSRVRRYVAPSGLRVLILTDRSAPIFSYQTWFRVGSSNEQPGKTGMAHFFEHLMFSETTSLAPGELDRLIEQTGGDNNAATWTDWTYYRTSLPAAELELAVRLESDRMRNLVLEDEQLETEREVVMSERMERVEDDVDGFLDEQLYALAFTAHPYRWPTIGWMDDIRSLDKASVQAFYRTFYAPNNATLVLVGDVDEDRALDLIGRYYGDIPAAELPPRPAIVEPAQTAERRQIFHKPVSSSRVLMGYKVPGQGHPDWPVLEFIAALLAGGLSSRLHRRLVIDTEIASSLECSVPPFCDPCLMRIGASVARDRTTGEAIAEIDAIIAALAEEAVPEDELDKVKSGVETDFWSMLEDCDGRGEALGHYESTLGDFRQVFTMAERLARVTAADIMRAARTYLLPERRTVVIAEPGPDSDGDSEGDGDSDDGKDPTTGADTGASEEQHA